MFYCEKCRAEKGWPTGIMGEPTSFGNCEVCSGRGRQPCYDIPCSYLPDPVPPAEGVRDAIKGEK
jgi:hypothetical protein